MPPSPHAALPPVALTIAGSDSSGGAGIQADLKTFSAFGVYGASVITALTAQNTLGVQGVHPVPAPFVSRQLESVCVDLPVAAVKIGMLADVDIIEAVEAGLRAHQLPHIVLDPVMVAKSGDRLLAPSARDALVRLLFPLAEIVTPNTEEARELIGGAPIETLEDMKEAARRISDLGARYVLVKGGHITGSAIDLLYGEGEETRFEGRRIDTPNTHGTGCTLSSAIAAGLARGASIPEAVGAAKAYIQGAIEQSLPLGGGHGPLHHMHRFFPKETE